MVRTLRADDGPAWERAFASVAEEGRWIGAESGIDHRSFGLLEKYLDRERSVLLLAEADGLVVGWISADVDDHRSAVIGMGIVEGFRRQGIGTRMMTAIVEWASGRADRLQLEVFPHNDAALALYRSFGFVEVATHRGAWRRRDGDRWDVVAMDLAL